jgi:indolepyruvate ferredoxin oxidoreductase beta subunit
VLVIIKKQKGMTKKLADFGLIVSGVGGQGLITLLKIIGEAAMAEGYEVRTAELHGLSQRGGSVEVHIRFGKLVYSPLIQTGQADLVIALEAQEAYSASRYAAKNKTIFLVNNFLQPIVGGFSYRIEEILKSIRGISKQIMIVSATDVCRKEFGTDVVSGVCLLGYAVKNSLIPLKKESIVSAIKKTVPEKYKELNVNAFMFSDRSGEAVIK